MKTQVEEHVIMKRSGYLSNMPMRTERVTARPLRICKIDDLQLQRSSWVCFSWKGCCCSGRGTCKLQQQQPLWRHPHGQGRLGALRLPGGVIPAVVDTRYPAKLEVAIERPGRHCTMAVMTEDVRTMSARLFGMLGSWTQDSATAVKLARGVKGQNGFELWRLLWVEHTPENESPALSWRRSLLTPRFPPREQEFSLALQKWEADIDRYSTLQSTGSVEPSATRTCEQFSHGVAERAQTTLSNACLLAGHVRRST